MAVAKRKAMQRRENAESRDCRRASESSAAAGCIRWKVSRIRAKYASGRRSAIRPMRFVIGTLEGKQVAFLARHGRGHRFLPGELNFRANIYAMKLLGVDRIISVSAVGSLQEDLRPGEFLVPDQFFDRTRHRVSTFFGDGIVAHVAFDKPTCPQVVGCAVRCQ